MKIQILIQKHVHCPHEAGAENFQQPGMWQVLPIRVRVKPHIFSTLFCEFVIILLQSFSTVATTSQLLAAPLRSQLFNSSHNSSQLFSTILTFAYLCAHLLNPFQLLSTFLSLTLLTSSHLFSTLLATSHLFSTLVDNVHLCPPHINSCQLAELFSPESSPLLNSFQLPNVSTEIIILLYQPMWLVQLASSLFPRNSSQPISTFLSSFDIFFNYAQLSCLLLQKKFSCKTQ